MPACPRLPRAPSCSRRSRTRPDCSRSQHSRRGSPGPPSRRPSTRSSRRTRLPDGACMLFVRSLDRLNAFRGRIRSPSVADLNSPPWPESSSPAPLNEPRTDAGAHNRREKPFEGSSRPGPGTARRPLPLPRRGAAPPHRPADPGPILRVDCGEDATHGSRLLVDELGQVRRVLRRTLLVDQHERLHQVAMQQKVHVRGIWGRWRGVDRVQDGHQPVDQEPTGGPQLLPARPRMFPPRDGARSSASRLLVMVGNDASVSPKRFTRSSLRRSACAQKTARWT